MGIAVNTFSSEYEDDACMLYSIGWIDNESNNWDNATIAADLASLDDNLVADLDQEGWEGCVAEHTEWAVNHPCAPSYDEYAHQIGKMIIEYECFMYFFGNACSNMLQ